MAYIEAMNITKSYGRKNVVLKDASFQASQGEYIAIVGANGCGKSTLLGILSGSLKADGGNLLVDGKEPFKNSRVFSRHIGFVPQENPLMENLSVYDNLKFWYCDTGRSLKQDLVNGVPAVL